MTPVHGVTNRVFRLYRSIVTPIALAVVASASYSCLPLTSIEDAPYQAACVATGIALCSSLLQSALENSDEVLTPLLYS